MTSFSRTRGSRKRIRTGTAAGKAAVLCAVSFAVSSALSACSSGAEADAAPASGNPSSSVSPAPRDPVTPEPEPSRPASPESGAGETSGSSGDAAGIVVPGRTTTGVVPLTSGAVAVGGSLSVKLGAIERTEAEPSMPGEVAGPAVRVEVAVINSGSAYHPLGASVLNLYYGPDRIPASSLSGSGEEDLPDAVPGGRTVTGTYEFTVPDDRTERVLVEIDVDPQLHVALFEGELSP